MVPPATLARDANVADNAAYPTTRHKQAHTLPPDFVDLGEEQFVVSDLAQLGLIGDVFLQRPVRGGSDDKMHALVFKPRHVASVTQVQSVVRPVEWTWPRQIPEQRVDMEHLR